tara:strand:- start:6339 stop:8705 length:2367 start_codon:yes stop_codon:yes gene_type:complete
MMKNKSTLAKLLAEEDIFVVHKQMETAYFDSKKRELGLPIWKDEDMTPDIYDLMVGHEIGHALWTPLDMLEKAAVRKINHGFVNIIEDARIEKKGKRKYPGLVGVFNRGYIGLVKKDFFGTAKKNVNALNLIDKINLFFKTADTNIVFSDEEKVWVKRVAKTETPDEVLDLAEELYAWMEENESETDNHDSGEDGSSMTMPGDGDVSNEENSENSENGEKSDAKSDGKSDDKSDDAGDGKSDETSDDAGPAGNSKTSDEDKSEDGGAGSSTDSEDSGEDEVESKSTDSDTDTTEGGESSTGKGGPPVAETDSASKNGLDALRDKGAENRIYARIPKVDLKSIIIDTDTLLKEWTQSYLIEKSKDHQKGLYFDKTFEEVEALKSDSKSTVAYMVKEFEMKKAADQYARAATSKTGSLDMSKLHTYKYNEDLFKKVTTLPGATNHGMVMVLDWSGSMSDNLKGTLAQMYNLIWFCRRTNIPFEVFAFSDVYAGNGEFRSKYSINIDEAKSFKAGDFALHSHFRLLNIFSSNISLSDEMSMMHILWMYACRFYRGYRDWSECGHPYSSPQSLSLGGTPLNDAIIAMMDLVPQFKKDTGVQKVNTIFLTDGASNQLDGIYDYRLITDGERKGMHERILNTVTSYKTKTVITDPVMNKTIEVGNSSQTTNSLLQLLKNRVPGMNIVGFFIAGSGKSGRVDKRTLYYLLEDRDWTKIQALIKLINKNKYLALNQLGYDEYYVLPGGNNLQVENETLSDDLVGAAKGKLKTAFGKMQKGKISSRQLLNKFVKMVA